MKKQKKKPATKRSKETSKPRRRTRRPASPASKKKAATKVKAIKPSAEIKKPALMAAEGADGIPSLPRLRQILGEYYQPVLDYEPIGNRVPFPTLTRRINDEWNLGGNKQFQDGEINPTTIVIGLSEDIDYRATH
jgi:hypothetical protein